MRDVNVCNLLISQMSLWSLIDSALCKGGQANEQSESCERTVTSRYCLLRKGCVSSVYLPNIWTGPRDKIWGNAPHVFLHDFNSSSTGRDGTAEKANNSYFVLCSRIADPANLASKAVLSFLLNIALFCPQNGHCGCIRMETKWKLYMWLHWQEKRREKEWTNQ